jgi:hypothetical protein
MSSGAWSLLPTLFQQTQFAYRLQTYVTLACAGLVLLGVLALARRAESGRATRTDRGLTFGLGIAVAFGLVLSAWQLWVPNTHICEQGSCLSYSNRADALRGLPTLLPGSWSAGHSYGDRSLPVVATTERFQFAAREVDDDRLVGWVGSIESRVASFTFPPRGQPFATNIVGGPYLVHVGGDVRVVGRDLSGELVLEGTSEAQAVPVELSAQLSTPVVLGRSMTAAAAALLLALAAIVAVRRWRWRSPRSQT